MNEFLQQLLVESRELIEQASDGLLSLRALAREYGTPGGGVSGAFHTLKWRRGDRGSFRRMERAMHAAEDMYFSDVRLRGRRPLTPSSWATAWHASIECFEWLDTLEQTWATSQPSAMAEVAQVVSRLGEPGVHLHWSARGCGGAAASWVTEILKRNSRIRAEAITAVKFVPDTDCFYRGEDPVGRMTALPGLLALELQPVSAWEPLETFDPFACNLVLTALTASTPGEVS